LLAVALSLFYIKLFFLLRYISTVGQRPAWTAFLAFALLGLLVSVLIGDLRKKHLLLRRREDELLDKHASLTRSEARLQALVTATSDVIYSMSPDWSKMLQLRSQTFLTPTDTPSSTWLQKYIPPEEQEGVMAAIHEAIRTRSTFTLEHRVWRADGTIGWTYSRAVPLLDDKGEVFEWFGMASETTERRQAHEALLRSEKLAATGRLAATIAHEVNNPLGAAMNAVYIARTSPDRAAEMLKLVEQELRRAALITQQTLGFYRESREEPVILPKLVDEVLSMYATKLQNRKVSVQCRYRCSRSARRDGCPEKCEECEGCLCVQAGESRQILSNLIANGIDALSDEGKMYIRVSRRSNGVQLTIADNGQGIRTEHLKRIFEPFFTTKETVGTGLGLWVTQELIRKHNGAIRVRSRRDKGTVFRVTFPAVPHVPKSVQPDSKPELQLR
jgi:signal transduction histidine kinase